MESFELVACVMWLVLWLHLKMNAITDLQC
jgi:hypothetical protein